MRYETIVVIPERVKREPGIHFAFETMARWIPVRLFQPPRNDSGKTGD
jgi:hypothetical protein